MKTLLPKVTPLCTEAALPPQTLRLDVRGEKEEVRRNLFELSLSFDALLKSSAEDEMELPIPPLKQSSPTVFATKFREFADPSASAYRIAVFSENYTGRDGITMIRNLLPYLESAGIKGRFFEDGCGELFIEGKSPAIFDSEGVILKAQEHEALGRDIFHYLACHVKQDMAAAVKKGDSYEYLFDISVFEKTPKDEKGGNRFVGQNIVDFHGAAPNFGNFLKPFFEKLLSAFRSGKLKMLIVDMNGQNQYAADSASAPICRSERDYFLPLKNEAGESIGFFGIADAFFQNADEKESPIRAIETQIDLDRLWLP